MSPKVSPSNTTSVEDIARRTAQILEMSSRLRQACAAMQEPGRTAPESQSMELHREILRIKARLAGLAYEKRRISRVYDCLLSGNQGELLEALEERVDLLRKQCERLRFACGELRSQGDVDEAELARQVSEASRTLQTLKSQNQELEAANQSARELTPDYLALESELELRCREQGVSLVSLLEQRALLEARKNCQQGAAPCSTLDQMLDTVLVEELQEELKEHRQTLSSLETQLADESVLSLLEGSAFDD